MCTVFYTTTAGAVSQIPPGIPGVGVLEVDGRRRDISPCSSPPPSYLLRAPQPGPTFHPQLRLLPRRHGFQPSIRRTQGVLYASAYNVGIWRSTDNGTTSEPRSTPFLTLRRRCLEERIRRSTTPTSCLMAHTPSCPPLRELSSEQIFRHNPLTAASLWPKRSNLAAPLL